MSFGFSWPQHSSWHDNTIKKLSLDPIFSEDILQMEKWLLGAGHTWSIILSSGVPNITGLSDKGRYKSITGVQFEEHILKSFVSQIYLCFIKP